MLSSEKNSAGELTPAFALTKPSIAAWLPWMAPSKLLHVRRWGFERRQLRCHLVDGQDVLVPHPLVIAHGFVEGSVAGEDLSEPVGAQFGVPKRVADALRRDEVLVVSGVADQRPPNAA